GRDLLWLLQPKIARRYHLQSERTHQVGDLGQLSLVVAGQHQPLARRQTACHQAASTAASCAANSAVVPARASISISRNCASVNGAFSAVPWISTMLPEFVSTKLASASAVESSA